VGTSGPKSFQVNQSDNTQAIAVNEEATVYSKSMDLDNGSHFALAYQASSGGTIALQIKVQQSHDGVNWAYPESYQTLEENLDDSDYHVKSLPLPVFKYLRFAITGLAGNAASTFINLFLSMQEL